ncbi:MAG: (2Fe-2S)-binding protein [Pseudodesulfovibrio sp.]|uniref:(2Fe-2S)-binding domain-containing protein n=1 Tax=Pseudodesulfovibrio aespoeensis (strain ATCC 700646 / DSM 10631 / Aspo-2) TaxID=643562 RepID=E6VRV0_PSEA9|nr:MULTISPECIES: (2Fe-2S)-binding protein [Pseudodesulfovibrio]MBU4191777.1 (2Fe-2S)-binding protein [Pseudomonadota bacterium]ADU64237.1 (2Fe-2S)-binding domain-containing protein [Pseudodesulfovibrio aespoeensis Aspo-2]MBU4243019.1 (2Fe-2S)-binding protein [Pseudomonadota bacterium]MBU4380286.1 (2Fe-2S)-binding protein [Pseudomonadota bacterium]MBU4474846.1 (2Fe-2S)-binding protein [Pseudomonadota bacterium]
MPIVFTLNGVEQRLDADDTLRALDLLREHCGVTGPKEGCGTGECGACAIWIDGVTRLSCLTLAGQLHGREVTTAEGLGNGLGEGLGGAEGLKKNHADQSSLHPVQTALAERGGVQCGYCTPGMAMTAAELLRNDPNPDRSAIREAISGNLCRCTGYHKIVDSIEAAAETMRKKR